MRRAVVLAWALLVSPAAAEPAALVVINMPPGGAPPDHCVGMTVVDVVGDGRYRVVVDEGEPKRWVARAGAVDRRQLLSLLKPRKTDRSQCGRIIIQADADQPYANVLSTISMLRYNGFERIMLIDTNDYGRWSPDERQP